MSSEKISVDLWCSAGTSVTQAYCFSTEAWLFGGFLARTDLAHFLHCSFAGFSRLLFFSRFHVQKDILSYLNITNWPLACAPPPTVPCYKHPGSATLEKTLWKILKDCRLFIDQSKKINHTTNEGRWEFIINILFGISIFLFGVIEFSAQPQFLFLRARWRIPPTCLRSSGR